MAAWNFDNPKRREVNASPARFLSVDAEVEDHEYVSGSEYRLTMGRLWRRHRQGDIIRPAYPGKETAGDA